MIFSQQLCSTPVPGQLQIKHHFLEIVLDKPRSNACLNVSQRLLLYCFYSTASTVLASKVLAFTALAFTVLLSAVLHFAALYRAVSASTSFILPLSIHWKFHVTGGQNRSLFFGVKRMPTSFPIFLFLPILLPPTQL